MKLKLFDLNIWMGRFLPDILSYVTSHDFDILTFQEVAGGALSKHGNNCYLEIDHATGMQSRITNALILEKDHRAFIGNATFVKPSLEIVSEQVVWMNKFFYLKTGDTFEDRDIPADPRNALSLKLKVGDAYVYIVSVHAAWGKRPTDEPYKIEQGKILYDYMKTLDAPFILVGDFNLIADTTVMRQLSQLGKNLTVTSGVLTTLNPRKHYLGSKVTDHLLAVDHCIVHPDIKVNTFEIIDTPDLSDHCGLLLEFEI